MQVFIAGSGKLATELLHTLNANTDYNVSPWPGDAVPEVRAIVVHAGSGREISTISGFCGRTSSVLVELATGSSLEASVPDYPIVLCPNTNILMLKFMCMLERSGSLFKGSEVRITESHQSSKTSVPGTAVSMAHALGVCASEVTSVRNSSQQIADLGIPQEHLARHAFHRIQIQEGPCSIAMETRLYGGSPYASGVQQIIAAIQHRALQARAYSINEFIENGWL
jgi:4-hydroxy-tetrahydrodipicolinate reductase